MYLHCVARDVIGANRGLEKREILLQRLGLFVLSEQTKFREQPFHRIDFK